MLPRVALTHLNDAMRVVARPDPARIARRAWPIWSRTVQQRSPSVTALVPAAMWWLGEAGGLALAEPLTGFSLTLRGPPSGPAETVATIRCLAGRAPAPLAARTHAVEPGVVHLHPARQRLVLLAPGHHRHDLPLHRSGRRLPDRQTTAGFDRRDAVLRRHDRVIGWIAANHVTGGGLVEWKIVPAASEGGGCTDRNAPRSRTPRGTPPESSPSVLWIRLLDTTPTDDHGGRTGRFRMNAAARRPG